jgi:naphthalene 1,2-dioxygenase ferredoxin component
LHSRPTDAIPFREYSGYQMSIDKTGWVRAAARSDLAEGEVLGIEVAGHSIALYDVDGRIFATDNICTHAYARLSDGWLDGGLIECPLHAARFDVQTGKVLDPPATEDLKTYPVRVVDDVIQVKLD